MSPALEITVGPTDERNGLRAGGHLVRKCEEKNGHGKQSIDAQSDFLRPLTSCGGEEKSNHGHGGDDGSGDDECCKDVERLSLYQNVGVDPYEGMGTAKILLYDSDISETDDIPILG